MNNRPIGIFDSGIGGLTVLREIRRALPGEDVVYFGDTARVPYGNKSKAAVIRFSGECVRFLAKKKVKLVVVACNTSSALALDYLKKSFRIPVLGVIEAGVIRALALTRSRKIGVIGTRSTIASKSYQRKIKRVNRRAVIYAKSCPLFVPLVEEGILGGKVAKQVVRMYLSVFLSKKIDTLILGCTHYPLLKREIAACLKGVKIVDSAKAVAGRTKELLLANKLLRLKRGEAKERFYLSDQPAVFAELAKLFLGREVPKPKVVNV